MLDRVRINSDEERELETVPLDRDSHRERLHKMVKVTALRIIALAHHGISEEKAASKNHRRFLIEKETDDFLQMLNDEIHRLERKAHLFDHGKSNE